MDKNDGIGLWGKMTVLLSCVDRYIFNISYKTTAYDGLPRMINSNLRQIFMFLL